MSPKVIDLLRQAVECVHRDSPIQWLEVEHLCRAALTEATRSEQETAIETLTMTSFRRDHAAFLKQADQIIACIEDLQV